MLKRPLLSLRRCSEGCRQVRPFDPGIFRVPDKSSICLISESPYKVVQVRKLLTLSLLLLDFSLTVKAATLIFISGCGSAISSAKEG